MRKKRKKKTKKRHLQDLNLRLLRRSDFESHALDHSAKMSFHIKMSFLFFVSFVKKQKKERRRKSHNYSPNYQTMKFWKNV